MLKIQALAVAMLLYRFLSLLLVNSSYFSFLPPISTFFNMLCKKMPNKYTINKSARTQTHSTYTSMHKANFLRQLKTAKYFCLSLFPGGFSAGKFGGGRSQRERERERVAAINMAHILEARTRVAFVCCCQKRKWVTAPHFGCGWCEVGRIFHRLYPGVSYHFAPLSFPVFATGLVLCVPRI